jgi:hypothetical protein
MTSMIYLQLTGVPEILETWNYNKQKIFDNKRNLYVPAEIKLTPELFVLDWIDMVQTTQSKFLLNKVC